MPDQASSRQSRANKESLLDRAIDSVKLQPEPPPKPHPPSADQTEWHKSVEQHHVVPGVTVRDVGLSVFGETRSLHDRPGSNEPIDSARQKVAHVIINGAEEAHQRGQKPPRFTLLSNLQKRCSVTPKNARPTNPHSVRRARHILAAMIRRRARLISVSRQLRLEQIRRIDAELRRAYASAPNPALITILF